jgi:DNA polymerase-3 subunit delta'
MSISSAEIPLPWQQEAWRSWVRRFQREEIPQATLIAGARGLGKGLLAELCARSLLCLNPREDTLPCGACISCSQYAAGSQADLLRLQPEAPRAQIKIDEVREFSRRLLLTSHNGGRRVGVIEPLEAMNANAANSFLKTLEEPPPRVHFIAVSHRPRLLPATVRSRCQMITLRRPAEDAAMEWLEQKVPGMAPALLEHAGGSPLKALALHESGHTDTVQRWSKGLLAMYQGRISPLSLASDWREEPLDQWLQWMTVQLMEIYRIKLGMSTPRNANAALRGLGRDMSWKQLRRICGETVQANRLSTTQSNKELLMESLLISWAEIDKRER